MKWAYTVEVGRPGEERKTRHRSGFRTAAEAIAARARVLTELEDGLFVPPSKLTVGQYLDRWFATGPTKGWKPNTMRDYRVAIKHVKRYLNDVPLQALTREQVRVFYSTLLKEGKLSRREGGVRAPMAPKTVANVHICLHAALADAIADTPPLRRSNPADDAFSYSRESSGRELQSWTLEEMRRFLAHIRQRASTGALTSRTARDADLYVVALATGMRRGELLGLRDRDLDLKHARISVRQQWTKAGDEGRKVVALKTGQKAWRTIDIDPDTVAMLERQRETVRVDREQWGPVYQDIGLVFPREDGTAQDPDQVTSRFERLAQECPSVPRITFHGMRHTHATLLLEDGVSIKVVAERLGDREDTVLKLYGHITPRGRVVAVASISSWWDDAEQAGAVDAELVGLRATIARLQEQLLDLKRRNAELAARREQSVSETSSLVAADPRNADISS